MQTVVVLDFGGQYKELIARRVRECGVYSVIEPGSKPLEKIIEMKPAGIILTGGPNSVYDDASPKCDKALFELGIPVLGICYGHQLMSYLLGGEIRPCAVSEYGRTSVTLDTNCRLFSGMDSEQTMLMSHTDHVVKAPAGFKTVAHTKDCSIAGMSDDVRRLYGIQFHPEVEHSDNGTEVIRRFVRDICETAGDYSIDDFIERQTKAIREQVGDATVLLALSGGVDSSVCAALLSRAVPGRLTCVFVDHGLMRKNEGDQIEEVFSKRDLNFVRINAQDRFLAGLKDVSDPEAKRKFIGEEFVEVFQEKAEQLGKIDYLAQGTIYPDVIESGANNSATIKSHHNIVGLTDKMKFKGVVEPLRGLFKDEVRILGRKLGLPDYLVDRQPFPGPGLAIRIIGDVSFEKLELLRDADAIFREEMERAKVNANQYFAVLTDLRSVGVMGDFRTYDYTIALRAVMTSNFMTCEYCKIPYEVLDRASKRITNEVNGVNRVVYDITSKPPATIEWE